MIRQATASDLPAIVAIFNAAIATRVAVAYADPQSVDTRRRWFEGHTHGHPIYVADRDGDIAGWLSIEPYSDRAAYAATAEISIYVAPHALRCGIGAQLLAHALAAAPELGITCFIARMFGTNAASRSFFERAGFVRWGMLPAIGRIDGEPRDVLIYGRHLAG